MEYLYKITVEIDDDMVQRLGQHDLDAVYETVRQAFSGCGFQERTEAGWSLRSEKTRIPSAMSGSWQMRSMIRGLAGI